MPKVKSTFPSWTTWFLTHNLSKETIVLFLSGKCYISKSKLLVHLKEFYFCADHHEVNDSPIEQVRLTVPITDDPSLPCLTFRTWVLGIISCAVLAFLNQFFGYRQNALYVSSVSAQIVVLPIGMLMASKLPRKSIQIPATNWSFSLNPGPFNLKEHVLITIFANSGSNSVYAVGIITIVKAFYFRDIHPVAAILLTLTTQVG